MSEPSVNAREARLASWWLRTIRRHFCYSCDRTTLHAHRHSNPAFDQLIEYEWRR